MISPDTAIKHQSTLSSPSWPRHPVPIVAGVWGSGRGKITAQIKKNGKITLGEVRDMFGSSRKYVQALLEYLDKEKVTKRVGDDRVLY